ncbi:MAG TPA: hypothetical protein VGM73_04845 [Candidatus Didemnitutus sp.]
MSATTSITWEQRMLPHLDSLAAKMVRSRHFGYLKTVADLLVGLSGPGWSRLADEDRMRYLEQMQIDFHPRGVGDSEYATDPDYSAVLDLIQSEVRAVRRRL